MHRQCRKLATVNYRHSLESLITSSRSFARVFTRCGANRCARCSRHLIATAISLRSTDSFVMREFIAYYDTPCSTFADEIFSPRSHQTSRRSRRSNDFVIYSRLHHSSRNRSSLLNHLSTPPTCKFIRARKSLPRPASSGKRGNGKAGEKQAGVMHRVVPRIKNCECHCASSISILLFSAPCKVSWDYC
jgi:hypothetical protein